MTLYKPFALSNSAKFPRTSLYILRIGQKLTFRRFYFCEDIAPKHTMTPNSEHSAKRKQGFFPLMSRIKAAYSLEQTDVSIAMVPVVDLLLCSLASSLVSSNLDIVSCYERRLSIVAYETTRFDGEL